MPVAFLAWQHRLKDGQLVDLLLVQWAVPRRDQTKCSLWVPLERQVWY